MRIVVLILSIIIISIIKVSATEQTPDLLIIENDTLYLKTFPLEQLENKIAPFDYKGFGFNSTGCYRGYVATWKVMNDKLMLIEVTKVDSTSEKLDLVAYFKKIDFEPTMINGLVHADWYSDTLKRDNSSLYYYNKERFYLSQNHLSGSDREIELIFNNGLLSDNRIERFDSYMIGNILSKEISYHRAWFLKRRLTTVEAEVIENNGEMVRVEIKDFGINRGFALKELKRMMNIKKNQEYWINPRYWDRKN